MRVGVYPAGRIPRLYRFLSLSLSSLWSLFYPLSLFYPKVSLSVETSARIRICNILIWNARQHAGGKKKTKNIEGDIEKKKQHRMILQVDHGRL